MELKDGPDAAHVKRTEQEAPDPPVFLLRRSMPWADAQRAGLVFAAFGSTLDAFEYHLARMVGASDRIVDHLFRFTRPVTGAYFWCPPIPRRARRPEPARLIPPADASGNTTSGAA